VTPEEAGLKIIGLVCGLPGERAWQRPLLMIKEYKAYVDGSGTGSPDLLVLAGYIAPAAVWLDFAKKWKAALNEVGIDYFKMSEMASESWRPYAAYFYRIIEEFEISAAISCSIRTAELAKVVKAFPWPSYVSGLEQLTNPYYLGFKCIIYFVAQKGQEAGLNEPVDFIFDDESEKALTTEMWDYLKISSAPELRKFMGDTPTYKKDHEVMPLQAADLYAWWVRKWTAEGVPNWADNLPFPWGVKRKMSRLFADFGEEFFWDEFKMALSPESRVRARIQNPKAVLKQIERRERGIEITFPDPSSPINWRVLSAGQPF
jgi:hypothetical protein